MVWTAGLSTAGAVAGSPSWTVQRSGWDRSSSPTIADVNGDGVNEIVIGHQDGLVHVINAATGQDIPHWPQPAIVAGSTATAVDSTPAVADLFRDGRKEIVVGVGSLWVQHQQGGVVVFNADGTRHCVFRTQDDGNVWANTGSPDGYTEPVFSSPAIGDITGSGYPDIVFGSFDSHIYAIDRNCNKILDFYNEDSVWSSPALYDIDGSGRKSILIGSDQAPGGIWNGTGGTFRALKWAPGFPGNSQILWSHQLNDTVWSSPAIGDITGDGRVDVVVGGGAFYNGSDGHKVFAWHADDGSALPGWPVTTGGATSSSPALGDLNGDGVADVVIGSRDGSVYAYRGNGQSLWTRQLTFNNSSPGGPITGSPIIADMTGSGHNQVGIGNDWGFFVLNGQDGGINAEPGIWQSYEDAGAVGNFGPAGWKLILANFNTPNHTSQLLAYSIPPPRVAPPWPMFRHDAAHLGGPVGTNLLPPGYCKRVTLNNHANPASAHGYWVVGAQGGIYALSGAPYYGGATGRAHGSVVGIAATHSGAGYYLLDAAGDIFPFGDARSLGSMAGYRLNAPIIALAPTPTGRGYWLLGRDGGVFSFGDAHFYGSMGSIRLNAPIISMTATATGRGY
ncbi:MAG TPA: VCBS repeat-containing protein, partial [Acidimicrobiia bacterium]|nr:VCBS repeat-containing protein [Acidimicrobiia bacterium]